ncbi:C39 family peptidase [Trichococcus sp. K1Tr]|uniref:C39 family peptidase n=1 Tax=Trichococcus sp. K1Tr TaxID=3020847 RepID=UPI002331017F|nr:C39 family peptidase [Trichococcus sp. K1Tr]MDB6353485.1 C39 family peptidase [Trichococcus sp. K1Tr]
MRRRTLLKRCLLITFIVSTLSIRLAPPESASVLDNQAAVAEAPKEVLLDVPLLNQMDYPVLYNGCEVTSLTMILQYNNVSISKNDVAAWLPSVPIIYENGLRGNPNDAFVGDITGYNSGFSVYHGPIAVLAANFVSSDRIKDITGSPFEAVINALNQGYPVWTITSTSYAPVDDMEVWQTPTGEVSISYNEHSVVVVGYDENYFYVNDPYGKKNQPVEKSSFIASWEQFGNQAVYIE